VKATIRDDNNKSYESRYGIWQDKLDELRQEYEDLTDRESQGRETFDQDAPAYEKLLDRVMNDIEQNRHDDTTPDKNWHILKLNKLNANAVKLDDNYAGDLRITSGYRCPIGNSRTSGNVPKSRHQYGKAFDFNQKSTDVEKTTEENYNVWRKAADIGLAAILYDQDDNQVSSTLLEQYVYPAMPTGITSYTHGHAEW